MIKALTLIGGPRGAVAALAGALVGAAMVWSWATVFKIPAAERAAVAAEQEVNRTAAREFERDAAQGSREIEKAIPNESDQTLRDILSGPRP